MVISPYYVAKLTLSSRAKISRPCDILISARSTLSALHTGQGSWIACLWVILNFVMLRITYLSLTTKLVPSFVYKTVRDFFNLKTFYIV